MPDQNTTTAALRPAKNACRERRPPSKRGDGESGVTSPICCLSCMSVSNSSPSLLHQLLAPSRDAVRDIVEPALTEQSLQNRRHFRWRSGTCLGQLGYLFRP